MKILGPNDTGRGILLEYDAGYISHEENKKIISEMREMDFSQDIILFAVLQKYDTPNKNGRIYPELLLKRENEKYQTLIKKGGMGIVSTKGDQAAMLIMNGATLGISSRGVGSLKNVKGQNIVQDDFELVCFDLVSSPSTPGAYVFSDINDREQYQESLDEKPKDVDKMKNLMSRLDSFLSK